MSHSTQPASTNPCRTRRAEKIERMRNASVVRKPSGRGSRRIRLLLPSSSLLAVVLLGAFLGLCCNVTTVLAAASAAAAAGDGYSIPADAIRIEAEELTAARLTRHLAGLIGNDSSANRLDGRPAIDERVNGKDSEDLEERGELEEQEERVGNQREAADDDGDDGRHLPTALARLNALLQAAEERKEKLESNAAVSRLLSINRGGFFRGLLVVWVPVSFLLPTLAHRPPTYYRGRASRERHHPALERDDNNIIDVHDGSPADSRPAKSAGRYNAQSSDYKFESHYGPLLSRQEAYFTLMKIDNLDCRWKLTCYASQQPNAYQPLSNLLRRLFDRSSKPEAAKAKQDYHPALKRFFTYVWADKKGSRFKSAQQCDAEYKLCPAPVHRLIRMDMIRFWQKLSKRFAIQLQDE